jgi:hypothetical protein
LRVDLPQGIDFAQDIGADPAIVVDVEVAFGLGKTFRRGLKR